jgi:hypothetical protein
MAIESGLAQRAPRARDARAGACAGACARGVDHEFMRGSRHKLVTEAIMR